MVKNKFSTKWKASKQPRKQRKYRHNAPIHVRRKFLAVNLDKALREKYNMRNIGVRKGDEVLIMRGKFGKKKGKIATVDVKKTRVSIEGINRTKKDGSKVVVWINPSNLKIVSLNIDDAKRFKNKFVEKEKKVEGPKSKEKRVKSKENKKAIGERNGN